MQALKLNPDERALVEFVDRAAQALPLGQRARVYRGLADSLNVRRHRSRLYKKAQILDAADRACAELDSSVTAG